VRASFKQIAGVETPDATVFVGTTEIVTVREPHDRPAREERTGSMALTNRLAFWI
jgi:hypothetical protein